MALAVPPVGVKVVVSVIRSEPRRRAERAADVSLQLTLWRPALSIVLLPVQAVTRFALRAPEGAVNVPCCVTRPDF